MTARALQEAKDQAVLKALTAMSGFWVPAAEWFELMHAIDDVVTEDQENRR